MQLIARVITDFFMMVLCVVFAPVDQQEFRIDLVRDRGYADTMIVRREDGGFGIYANKKGELAKHATITPKEGEAGVFIVTDAKGQSETVDLAQGIKDFDLEQLGARERLQLKTLDGDGITVQRSGKVTYITVDKSGDTFVLH